jgi:hypothetical protein
MARRGKPPTAVAVARLDYADLRRMGDHQTDYPPFPSMLLSRDTNNALDIFWLPCRPSPRTGPMRLLMPPLRGPPFLCEVHPQLAEMLCKTTNMSNKSYPDPQNSFGIHRPLVNKADMRERRKATWRHRTSAQTILHGVLRGAANLRMKCSQQGMRIRVCVSEKGKPVVRRGRKAYGPPI